eukprot:4917627-Pleurochrysis_carterae.AAC.6
MEVLAETLGPKFAYDSYRVEAAILRGALFAIAPRRLEVKRSAIAARSAGDPPPRPGVSCPEPDVSQAGELLAYEQSQKSTDQSFNRFMVPSNAPPGFSFTIRSKYDDVETMRAIRQ